MSKLFESRQEKDERMAQEIRRNADNSDVGVWIRENPPPPEWKGTPMEWAYLESPASLWWLAPETDDSGLEW